LALQRDHYGKSPEPLLAGLARRGDRHAFEELVRRRQSWIRNLMRRCCGDSTLADDLAQQVFLQAWRKIRHLQRTDAFAGWLKRLAINEWLQHLRRNDPLRQSDEHDDLLPAKHTSAGAAMDLDRALGTLPEPVRMCIVLSYHEGMTHGEIAGLTDIPLGTVKSHIRRGTKQLQQQLADYIDAPRAEESS